MQPVLLDTCAAIWILEDEKIADRASQLLDDAHAAGTPTFVSPITAWEIGLLVSRQRLQMIATPEGWFSRLVQLPNVKLAGLTPSLLIASSFLPGKPPRDPADRIIAATARDLGATVVTRDRVLLEYGAQGHISVLAC